MIQDDMKIFGIELAKAFMVRDKECSPAKQLAWFEKLQRFPVERVIPALRLVGESSTDFINPGQVADAIKVAVEAERGRTNDREKLAVEWLIAMAVEDGEDMSEFQGKGMVVR